MMQDEKVADSSPEKMRVGSYEPPESRALRFMLGEISPGISWRNTYTTYLTSLILLLAALHPFSIFA